MNIASIEELNGNPTRIKVIGVGGCGSNAVDHMSREGLRGVELIAVNTDLQALSKVKVEQRVQIGSKITKGLGAGGNPSVGEDAANEDEEQIRSMLNGADMVFVTAGMGGGTGTGAAPVVAQIAKDLGILVVGVVTKPWVFEGRRKMSYADAGLERMRSAVDTLLIIPNENILKNFDENLSMEEAYALADNVLYNAVRGITDLITKHGKMNIDFADVRNVMKDKQDAVLGVGLASGPNRAVEAARAAIENRMLEEQCIDGARHLLVNVSGANVGMKEINMVVSSMTSVADPEVSTIIGHTITDALGDNILVTVVATDFNRSAQILQHPTASEVKTSNYVSQEAWNEMTGGKPLTMLRAEEQHPTARMPFKREPRDQELFNDTDSLDVPTILRKPNFFDEAGTGERKAR